MVGALAGKEEMKGREREEEEGEEDILACVEDDDLIKKERMWQKIMKKTGSRRTYNRFRFLTFQSQR